MCVCRKHWHKKKTRNDTPEALCSLIAGKRANASSSSSSCLATQFDRPTGQKIAHHQPKPYRTSHLFVQRHEATTDHHRCRRRRRRRQRLHHRCSMRFVCRYLSTGPSVFHAPCWHSECVFVCACSGRLLARAQKHHQLHQQQPE